jgi:hypothetical protein
MDIDNPRPRPAGPRVHVSQRGAVLARLKVVVVNALSLGTDCGSLALAVALALA